MIDAQTLSPGTDIHAIRNIRRWTPGDCVWCGDNRSVEMFRNEPRCGTCREQESIIDEARKFVGMYGLRPIGGTLQADDDEEYEHRLGARDARRALNETRLDELPDPAAVRKALRPRAATVVAESPGAAASNGEAAAPKSRSGATSRPAAPRQQSRSAASSPAESVDVKALETRVAGLLDQLGSIDAETAKIGEPAGLAARARLSDLTKQRATVLRTLAALEKARIAASN
ncbi:hypothetical protein [Rhodococcus sp. NPDC058521]|uniref:hypothetical protein n=1 Tax=Rhodococcus sp. NPDC058521 TaxID=3346536 RepID=UPI003648AA64